MECFPSSGQLGSGQLLYPKADIDQIFKNAPFLLPLPEAPGRFPLSLSTVRTWSKFWGPPYCPGVFKSQTCPH